MAFTGRIGTLSSKFGNIVLGISDELGKSIFDCQVHVLTANQIRVSYTFEVTNTGINPDNYILTSLADPPDSAVLPNIDSINWYDSTHRSVVLTLSQSLTYNTLYSLESNGIYAEIDHEVISGFVRNFLANVQDTPQVIGAWLSKRGKIDIKFSQSVGLTSGLATFEIRDASATPGTGVPIPQDVWVIENLPDDTLRVDYTGSLPISFNALAIDFTDVTDSSLNQSSGSVPVTLVLRSPSPYSEANLLQLQLIDAFVVDVNSNINTTTVRAFFNGPVLDADDISNWVIIQDGSHIYSDIINNITTIDASNLSTLLDLCNAIRIQFNSHLVEPQVHTKNDLTNNLSGSPIDLSQAINFLIIAQTNYLTHVTTNQYHKYPDFVNIYSPLLIHDLLTAIREANTIKENYNNHLSATYLVNFSTLYPIPIGEITTYARYDVVNRVFDVIDSYTYYADLHLNTKSFTSPLTIEATLMSEDGVSTTNPADYTGNIQVKSITNPAELISDQIIPNSKISCRFDKGIMIQPLDIVQILGPDGLKIPINYKIFSTWPTAIWALNNLIFAYSIHVGSNGAGHLFLDNTNTISSLDYAELPEANILNLANSFRVKLNNHIASTQYHYQYDDESPSVSPAVDLESLVDLLNNLRHVFMTHNSKLGVHSFVGPKLVSAILYDLLECNLSFMINEKIQIINGLIHSCYIDDEINYLNSIILSYQFIGLATHPFVSSAIPKSGLVINDIGIQFESDEVEVYFSKPMRQIPLDTSNLIISGGSILQKESSWINNSAASIRVSNMEAISYTITAINLTDIAGNLIY